MKEIKLNEKCDCCGTWHNIENLTVDDERILCAFCVMMLEARAEPVTD